jgi:hypothetical protein
MRAVIWTKGHSQEGLRPGRELIGDRGIKSTGTLDSGKDETPKTPELRSGKVTGACRGRDRVKKGPVDRVFHRDSFGSPKR